MTNSKSLAEIGYRLDEVRRFLGYADTRMDAGLFCYVLLMLKRPDLFIERPAPRISLHYFQWRRFRGISIRARDIREVETYLDGFRQGRDWTYPSERTVRANLRSRDYMRDAAMRIEWDIQKRDVLDRRALRILKEMGSGLRLIARARGLFEREAGLRARDVQRRLHVPAKVAAWLIDNEVKAGHVRLVHYHSGPPLIVRTR